MIALEDIIRDYGAGLGRVAAVYEADRSLQEDLLQETLLAIHRALPNLRDTERLPAFVFRIAHNRGVTHVVRERSARRPQLVDETEASTNPEEDVLARDRARRLQAAVRRLPLGRGPRFGRPQSHGDRSHIGAQRIQCRRSPQPGQGDLEGTAR
jgi:RNA polymerase sigma-70 factor (ECF subfamily)